VCHARVVIQVGPDLPGVLVEAARAAGLAASGRGVAAHEVHSGVVPEDGLPRLAAPLDRALAAHVHVVDRAADLSERKRLDVGRAGVDHERRRGVGTGVEHGRGLARAAREHADGGRDHDAAHDGDTKHRGREYHSALGILALLAVSLATSCAASAETRAQAVLVIDTDLPLAGSDVGVRVAAMDTLRVDVLDRDGASVVDTRDFVLADRRDWPLSIGVVARARLRLHLLQARLPTPELTVDRLVDVGPAGSGVERVRVVLSGDCLGRVVDLAAGTTCLTAARLAAPASEGVVADDGSASRAESWAFASPRPCSGAADPERPCVPGSFDVLGDVGLARMPTRREEPLPLRPVVVSPFRMDRAEVTVGNYRELLRAGMLAGVEAPTKRDAGSESSAYCTYMGSADASADMLPLNCAPARLARAMCAARGGRLPTEAEWEHAARRGDGRIYPWGNEAAACCTTSASRSPITSIGAACPRGPLEPVASHVGREAGCPGGGDVSRDGIVDLGGSLAELTSDDFRPVAECFSSGLMFDPACRITGNGPFVRKGTDWTAGLARTRAAYRGESTGPGETLGFRCVYPEPTP
jgi:formylglycine-generating enzyme required for sulfatase activity